MAILVTGGAGYIGSHTVVELQTAGYEVVRNHEFAPIKNKTGIDSVESARALCAENGIVL